MPSFALSQIERRLTELACPPALLRRRIRELAEHHEDLKQNALEEGLSETDAETRADERLGEPVALAERLAAALRQSSWWGRHPIIGFCLLPPFAILSLFILTLYFDYAVCYVSLSEDQISGLANGGRELKFCRWLVNGDLYASIILVTALFATLARRTAAGIRWSLVACVMGALLGTFCYVSITPHNFTFGFWNHAHWTGLLLPLAIAFAMWRRWRQSLRPLAPLPADLRSAHAETTAMPDVRRSGMVTPTSVITFLILTTLVVLAFSALHHPHRASSATRAVQSNR